MVHAIRAGVELRPLDTIGIAATDRWCYGEI
jgi:hypothetical protein